MKFKNKSKEMTLMMVMSIRLILPAHLESSLRALVNLYCADVYQDIATM